ncbi:MAG: HEPN domain-containing protein [Candidatus Aenigmatarchaeota archaeon]
MEKKYEKAIKEIVNEWLKDAEEELKAAKTLLRELPEKSAVHAQQAAEKFLKAFLAFHNQLIPKTHVIEILIKKCMKIDEDFSNLLTPEIIILTEYYRARYPPKKLIISQEEAEKAIEIAEKVKNFVLNKLKEKLE